MFSTWCQEDCLYRFIHRVENIHSRIEERRNPMKKKKCHRHTVMMLKAIMMIFSLNFYQIFITNKICWVLGLQLFSQFLSNIFHQAMMMICITYQICWEQWWWLSWSYIFHLFSAVFIFLGKSTCVNYIKIFPKFNHISCYKWWWYFFWELKIRWISIPFFNFIIYSGTTKCPAKI